MMRVDMTPRKMCSFHGFCGITPKPRLVNPSDAWSSELIGEALNG